MNPYETTKKCHFSYCYDRNALLDCLGALCDDLFSGDKGDVLTLNFGDLEVHIVIIDDCEGDCDD